MKIYLQFELALSLVISFSLDPIKLWFLTDSYGGFSWNDYAVQLVAQLSETVGSLLSVGFISVKQKWGGIGVGRYHPTFNQAKLAEGQARPA